MAMCEFAYKKNGNDDTVRCRLLSPSGDCCGNVKFCRMTGHWENSGNYKGCPIRKTGITQGKGKENGRSI